MKRPTQVDVARLAGVSRATVSYVVNDPTDQRIPISAETRQRVLNAIAELGYEIDARAQALRSGETKTIGVLIPLYENPFFWQILRGISAEAEKSGYSVLLAHSSLTPEQEIRSIRELPEQRLDGLVLLMEFKLLPDQVLDQLRNSSHPIVEISATDSEFDLVRQGYGAGTKALMSHLIELGHERIGFIYGVAMPAQGFDRLDAYRQALEEAGLTYDETLVNQCGPLLDDGYQAAHDLLNRPDRPTALLAINDLLAMATIRAANDLGLRLPDDVSVASFDDIPFAGFTVPRLTSVSGHPEQNGRDAVRLLLKRLNDPDRPHEVITSGWQLNIRESTGPAPRKHP
ncbi:MAG: LacI family transcriptional regulator [Anaerolineae bacterium]|nr:LacI family transcriptional regulator [Anaerolineae bacterium]